MKIFNTRNLITSLLSFILCGVTFTPPSWAAYPERVVTLVVPFTAGSGSDILARIISPRLAERWQQAVIVDNRPGASGNIGADFVAKAPPDGINLLMAINTITMAPNLYKKPGFDPVTDFSPVMKLTVANFAIVTNPALAANDLKSLVQLIKAHPNQYNYGSPGNGTPHHLAMELMKMQLGLDASRPLQRHQRCNHRFIGWTSSIDVRQCSLDAPPCQSWQTQNDRCDWS